MVRRRRPLKVQAAGHHFPLKTSVLPVIFVGLVYIDASSKIQLNFYELQKFHFDPPSPSFFFHSSFPSLSLFLSLLFLLFLLLFPDFWFSEKSPPAPNMSPNGHLLGGGGVF